MQLDYGTILCPEPIALSIGTLRSPTLREIGNLGFDRFGYYEFLIKMTPEVFFTNVKGNEGKAYWESLSEEERGKITIYDVIVEDERLIRSYIEIFNFFFIEPVVFKEGFFILLKEDIDGSSDFNTDNIRGIITKDNILQVLELLQQVCCINEKKEELSNLKFKNDLTKKLYEKMQKANKKKVEEKRVDINLTLPNIISSVSNRHPSINPLNVWDLTVFQLLDSFNRMQINSLYDIDATRISVWGDEKKTFDASLWYKNEYDKK